MRNLLRKIIGKKAKMENNIEEIDIELLDQELKLFVYKWTKGDNDGQVCEYDNLFKDPVTGIIWVNFKGGSRINYNLIEEYMMQLDPSSINTTSFTSPPIKDAVIKEAPVKNIMVSSDVTVTAENVNPIISLLQKQKPNWVEVGIKLKLNLPTKSLYSVLTSSFEDADHEIIEFVVRDLDLEIIKDSLRNNIKDIYKSNGTIRKSGSDLGKEE